MTSSRAPRTSVVCVGAAAAAIQLLAALAARVRQGIPSWIGSITIVDPAVHPDGGSSHSDISPGFRVNMRSAPHNIPGQLSFQEFLLRYGGSKENPPLRADLGAYLTFVKFNVVNELVRSGVEISFKRATAVALHRNGSEYNVLLDNNDQLRSRFVVLATGNAPPSVPQNVLFMAGTGPVTSYTGGASFAQEIRREDRVLVLGTGPGGIDVARYLIDTLRICGEVDLASRTGLLSAVQALEPPRDAIVSTVKAAVAQLVNNPPISIQMLADTVVPLFDAFDHSFDLVSILDPPATPLAGLVSDINAAQKGGPEWRQVLEAIGTFAPDIWAAMGVPAKLNFLNHWERLYYVKRHAMQLETAKWLAAQLAVGKIRAGRLDPASTEISVGREGALASIEFWPEPPKVYGYDRLVVATGPEYKVSRSQNPLIRHMLDRRLAKPAMIANGSKAIEVGGFSTHGLELDGLDGVFAMGALVRGEYFAVHSFPALARHAAIILNRIENR